MKFKKLSVGESNVTNGFPSRDVCDDHGVVAHVYEVTLDDEILSHLFAAAPELYDLLDRINVAFYTRTTRVEWMKLMEESKPLLRRARGEERE